MRLVADDTETRCCFARQDDRRLRCPHGIVHPDPEDELLLYPCAERLLSLVLDLLLLGMMQKMRSKLLRLLLVHWSATKLMLLQLLLVMMFSRRPSRMP